MSKLVKLCSGFAVLAVSLAVCSGAAYAARSGTITGDRVNVRSKPSTEARVLEKAEKGDSVSILDEADGWYRVSIDGTKGWVSSSFVKLSGSKSGSGSKSSKAKTSTSLSSRGSSEDVPQSPNGSNIVAYAKKFIGVRYVYGASSPSGFDCSGFTSYVYRHFGIYLERVAADQSRQGQHIDKSNLSPGDLVFFDTNGGHNYVNHAGIYIGGGNFIHASSGSAHSVTISSLNDSFYENAYMTARRIN
ncbi:MAG TPA: SH3 domain-containing C40 family peptidase [Clostridia bacterium]